MINFDVTREWNFSDDVLRERRYLETVVNPNDVIHELVGSIENVVLLKNEPQRIQSTDRSGLCRNN